MAVSFSDSIHVTTEKCDAKVMPVLVGIIEIEISISVMSVLDSEIYVKHTNTRFCRTICRVINGGQ